MLTEFAPSQHLIDAVADAVMARRGKAHGKRIRFLCPEHADNDPSADFDTERLVWTCRQCHAGGGLTDLAKLLDIDLAEYQDEITIIHRNGNGHHKEPIPLVTFAAWCETRKLDAEFLRSFYGIEETRHKRRPAIRYETKRGYRVRYLDGNKPKATWETTGAGQTLYNLGEALLLSDERVYLVNGEPSVWACQQRGVPAFCLCTGEMAPSDAACAPLRDAVGDRTVYVVYDRDEAGQNGSRQAVAAMQAAGIKAVALILPDTLPDNGDVDDLHRITGAGLGAALAGLPELGAEAPRIDLAEQDRREWHERIADNRIPLAELPYWVNRIATTFQPLASPFNEDGGRSNDYLSVMILPFWSSLFPAVRIQNLSGAIWALGIAIAGSGKNQVTDALHEMITLVHDNATTEPVIHFTSGTPEGMWRDLDGTGKKMIIYQDEFGGWLKQLKRDHMMSAREAMCGLYDGRIVGYRTSKGPVTVRKPHVVACGTTNPIDFRDNLKTIDVTSGYISRFMLSYPDHDDTLPDRDSFAEWEVEQLVIDLTMLARKCADITTAVWAETGTGKEPEIVTEFGRYLGLNTGRRVIPELEMLDPKMPAGRPFARLKKIALVMALGEYEPRTITYRNNRAVVIEQQHIDLAIRYVQQEMAYGKRAQLQLGQSEDYALTLKIEQFLLQHPDGLTQRDISRRTGKSAGEIEVALRLLLRDGKIVGSKVGKTERWKMEWL